MKQMSLLAMAIGEGRVKDLARKLKDQKPIFIRGQSALADRLAAGEVAIGVGSWLYKALWYQDKGAPIDWVRISPLVISSQRLSVLKKAPHPNAARLWAGWLMTPEGQQMFESLEYHSRIGAGSTGRQWRAIQEAKMELWEYPSTPEAAERVNVLVKEFGKIFGTR